MEDNEDMIIRKGFKIKYDGKALTNVDSLTYNGYIESVANLMKAHILLMREVFPESKENWFCGSATICDLYHYSDNLILTYGREEESAGLSDVSDIYVEIDF